MSDQDTPQPQDNAGETVSTDTQQSKAFDELLATIKNDKGEQKFSSVDQALQSIPHKDAHITKLEQESSELRKNLEELEAKVNATQTTEELMEKFKASQQNNADTPQGSGLDNSQLEEFVRTLTEKTLTERESRSVQQKNVAEFEKQMLATYGTQEKAAEKVNKVASDLGWTTKQALEFVAHNGMRSAQKLFDLSNTPPLSAGKLPESSHNMDANTSTTTKPSVKLGAYPDTKAVVNAWHAAKPE